MKNVQQYVSPSLSSALVIDDHPFVRESLTHLLQQLGVLKIETAMNGVDAKAQLLTSAAGVDLILCDLNMPKADGLVFLRWLSEQSINTPVILISGEDTEVLQAAQRLGKTRNLNIAGIAEKPLSFVALQELLEIIHDEQGKGLTNASRQTPRTPLPTLSPMELEDMVAANHFEVWFQPQVFTRTGEVHGLEALLRLRHPIHGIIPPDAFIPIAEDSGLINALTTFVIDECIERLASWQREMAGLNVSINLSASILDKLYIPDLLYDQCTERGVNSKNVVIELTEASLAGDAAVLLEIMTRLRLKKFKLSIDDFGTGFSSLEQLKGLPFHELKLDKSFVFDAVTDKRSRSILLNSLQLASDLNLTSVAEGVETQSHMDLITELGCDLAQGYLIARPMHADAVSNWLSDYRLQLG